MKRNLLLNKDLYGVKYFIKDLSLLKHLNVENLQLYKIGTTRRLDLLFYIKDIKKYNVYKWLCTKEPLFLNMSFKDKMCCASFIADKKFNTTLDMIIDSKTIDCISKERILELCETL